MRALIPLVACLCALLLVATPAPDPLVATLTYPAEGALDVGAGQPFEWQAVAGAQVYYLYVGTTPGANDVINTGEFLATQFLPASFPDNQTLYARFWTKHGGIWRYADSTFTTRPLTAVLTVPTAGQQNLWFAPTFQWTAVSGTERYYLYVGTSPGAKDVVNTGEIQTTSFAVTNLPVGANLYARMWTRIAGVWRYRDSTFATQTGSAALTSPANGQSSVSLTPTFTWSVVANAYRYYLYVGTTVGAKDVIDTGELQTTSYGGPTLPADRTLYARLWTLVNGTWRDRDTTFATQPIMAALTSPVDGASSVSIPTTFQWNTVPAVQAYYLYVGTVPGAKDVVNTGETIQTSWTATLPGATTLYARLWTKMGNIWRYADSKFGTQAVAAVLSYPVNGLTGIPVDLTFSWNPISGADRYTLDIGTSPGASDVFQGGELTATSVPVTGLPEGLLLHARLGTRQGGVWYYVNSTFTTTIERAVLTTPTNGQSDVSSSVVFQWTTVPDAEGYYLSVGTSAGATNIIDTGETDQVSWTATVPDSSTLYARLWTKVGGIWRFVDSTFSTVNLRARFIHPTIATVGVDPAQPFQWTAVAGAEGYTLHIGSSWGASDLLDSGEIPATSYAPMGLPVDRTLYARIWTRYGGVSRFDDTIFTLEASAPYSRIIEPADGELNFSTGRPFHWSKVAMASGYRLLLGTAPGSSDLHNSGEIFVTKRFVRDLPLGITIFGRLQTHVGDDWVSADFSFSVGSTAPVAATTIDTVLWATAEVRAMADDQNQTMPWSALARTRVGAAICSDYTQVLLLALQQVDPGTPSRPVALAFTPGTLDTHVLVELLRPDTDTWMLLDPTFALTVRRTADSAFATAEDVRTATLALDWAGVTYEFLSGSGDAYVRGYYLDYPFLYLNVGHGGLPYADPPPSPAAFLEEAALPVTSSYALYVIQCQAGESQTSAVVDGETLTVACGGPDSFSTAFDATSISMPAGSTFRVFKPRRFVF